jgi:choline kinase/SAM-dependent methyltransferase
LQIHCIDCREYATTNNIYSLWVAREHIRAPFVLIESDLVFDSHLLGLLRVSNRIAVARYRSHMRGTTVSFDDSGRVEAFAVGAVNGARRAYKTVNLYSLSLPIWQEVSRRLEHRIASGRVHDYYEVVFAEMAAEGLLPFEAVHFDDGRWCEIDTPQDLVAAEQLFSESGTTPSCPVTATRPVQHQESGHNGVAVAGAGSPQLDYTKVRAYWKQATPSILGPYMMEGFGFPACAGRFRFRREQDAVARAIKSLPSSCSVLDLGSGVGFWTEYFARRFATVVSVEASPVLYSALTDRCSQYPNVSTCNGDVLSFEPREKFGLVFLGGLLMYLNEHDVRALLERLAPSLESGAMILCRESTVRRGTKTLQGEYQVVYRSVETYRRIFADAGFDVVSAEANAAYICPQMGCELVK